MKDNTSIGFIGFGQMGAAIAYAIHQSFLNINLYVVESNVDRQDWIRTNHPEVNQVSIEALCDACEFIFLAIKPQHVTDLAHQVKPFLTNRHCLISMLAGVSHASCLSLFQPANIIRIMPNTPAKLSKGVTGVYFLDALPKEMQALGLELCGAFGKTVQLNSDDDIDVITAISGSGPAFFYRIIRTFVSFGVDAGLDPQVAKDAAINTMLGASYMLLDDPEPDDQIKRVASPNGTTQAGLEVMDQKEFDTLMTSVLNRAYERAVELSKEQ